jgi:hypothetical protein
MDKHMASDKKTICGQPFQSEKEVCCLPSIAKVKLPNGVVWPFLFGGRRYRQAVPAFNRSPFLFGDIFDFLSDSSFLSWAAK